jgi:hypothetical protein
VIRQWHELNSNKISTKSLAMSETYRIFAHGLAGMCRNQQQLFNPLNLKHYEE